MMNYNMSMNKQNIIDRLMCASACIIQALAFYISLNHEAFKSTIIPFPNIVIPTLNITTSVLCLFLTFFPKFSYLKISILFVQSVATTLNELEILGTFLYAAAIILLFCDRFFKIKVKRKIIILSVIWFLVSLGTIPFGLYRFLRVVALSLFFITFYLSIYFRLEKYMPMHTLDGQSDFVYSFFYFNTKFTIIKEKNFFILNVFFTKMSILF